MKVESSWPSKFGFSLGKASMERLTSWLNAFHQALKVFLAQFSKWMISLQPHRLPFLDQAYSILDQDPPHHQTHTLSESKSP